MQGQTQVQTRKSYDTRVKYLVRAGLLPDIYRKQIHRSLIWKWERESKEKYVGCELNAEMEELYELLKKLSLDDKMQKALRVFYRINKTFKDIIGQGKDFIKTLKQHKYKIVDVINQGKETIGLTRAIKLFGISRSTFRTWAMESFFHCGASISKLCNNAYPQQLTVNEVHKMHKMLTSQKYLHWPIISVAYYGMRKSMLKAHPNTWYKYARLMMITRKRKKKFIKVYPEGIRASAPNEMWHADITEFKTADGVISYIYLVLDNFSKFITSWRVSERICGKLRMETFKETIELAGIKPKTLNQALTTDLIVDGGSENNNQVVETLLGQYPIEKVIALKDIQKSNAMIERVNQLIKYNYLYPKQIQNQTQLINYLRDFVIPDYNNKRPHGSLSGLTPLEAYAGKSINFKKIRQKMIQALQERVQFNQNHSCLGCPFGCSN
jgi:putative transposase